MRNLLALTVSILLHLTLLYFILNLDIEIEEKVKKKFSVTVVKKEQETEKKSNNDFLEPSIRSNEMDPLLPDSSNYIDSLISLTPVLDSSIEFSNVVSTRKREDSFLNNLESLIVKPQIEMSEPDNSSKMSINWSGEGRKNRGSNEIDFTTFPKETFTGVDISVEFNVSENGEVYNSYIVPPGSGSVEFDILVLEYVNNFTFEEGEVTTGVLKIIYE